MLAELGLVLPPDELARRHRGAIDDDFLVGLTADYARVFPDDIVSTHRARRLEALATQVRPIDGELELLRALGESGSASASPRTVNRRRWR